MNEPNIERAFLEVENSAISQRWRERLDPNQNHIAMAIAQSADVPDLVARVMAARGVDIDQAATYQNPKLRDLLPDPASFTDMELASKRIANAISSGERVAIFGDYDVDGASSSALMSKFLRHYNVPHEIYIPDRIFEGYGPNPAAIEELAGKGATLIITVDCGATSFEALEEARDIDADVVVLDHHQMGSEMPPCVALVNPNRQDDLSGQGHMCAAGVVFITLVAIAKFIRENNGVSAIAPPNIIEWLDLVGLATVCDVVPLTGVNRAFVVQGLQLMRQRRNAGLVALCEVARLDGPVEAFHLGFVLGPRINAGGRIGDAALGARLLTTSEREEALEIAQQLDALNKERQQAEVKMLEEAIAEADAEYGSDGGPSVIVTQSDKWHPGIVGLLASRLKDRFKRPAFAISFNGMGVGSGSGRSIPGIDLGGAVREAVEQNVLEKGGGHAMAAGLTVKREKLGELRGFFEEKLAQKVSEQSANQVLEIDAALTARSANFELIDALESVGPYGSGAPAPVFAFPLHLVTYADMVGQSHIKLSLASGDGAKLNAIAFRAIDTPLGDLLLASRGKRIHICGNLSVNIWQGRKQLQLRVIDAAMPGSIR